MQPYSEYIVQCSYTRPVSSRKTKTVRRAVANVLFPLENFSKYTLRYAYTIYIIIQCVYTQRSTALSETRRFDRTRSIPGRGIISDEPLKRHRRRRSRLARKLLRFLSSLVSFPLRPRLAFVFQRTPPDLFFILHFRDDGGEGFPLPPRRRRSPTKKFTVPSDGTFHTRPRSADTISNYAIHTEIRPSLTSVAQGVRYYTVDLTREPI